MSINWALLVTQGRAKAFGVSWSEKEKEAIYVNKVPVEAVRQGCLTLEAYQKLKEDKQEQVEATGRIALNDLTLAELRLLCEEKGLNYTPEATISSLIEILSNIGVAGKEVEVPKCDLCDFVAKSKTGLAVHSKKHK